MRFSNASSNPVDPASASRQELVLTPAPEHRVQFYEDEAFLATAVADFLAAGLATGQSLVVIATEPHRDAFLRQLSAEGFDVESARGTGQLVLLDARDTLAMFMDGAMPDAERFREVIGQVLDAARARHGAPPVLRLYGEMVDVLWKEGNTDGAIRLEELWNELSHTQAFSLLCAYAMGNFYKAADAERFQAICRQHTHVVPTEQYVRADDEARLVEITLLQQRARALEAEIEQRKVLEQRLRDLLVERDRLLTAERTARADAENATRAKSQFLAVMSHELRTPLNAIAGHVQLLTLGIHGPISDPQREALDRVARSQRHLLRLINEVLNLARIETGRVEYAMADVAVQDVVTELLPMVEPQLAARRLRYEVRLPAERILVRADREKFEQVMLNLITNAAKFTPPGGHVTIDVAARSACPELVFVRVSDTGIGIPREKHDAIFEPFVQVNTGPTRTADGAGLGLAISREIARGMGGDIRVRSVEGRGSTFTLTLRRSPADAVSASRAPSPRA